MRTAISIISLLLIGTSVSGQVLDGFMGVPWGSPPSSFPGGTFVQHKIKSGYSYPDTTMIGSHIQVKWKLILDSLGAIGSTSVFVSFFDHRLHSVDIYSGEADAKDGNGKLLYNTMLAKYGHPDTVYFEACESAEWNNGISFRSVSLCSNGRAVFSMCSLKIGNDIIEAYSSANQNSIPPTETSAWKIKYYVDEFGDPTRIRYVTKTSRIRGIFSNTETQGSPLDVLFLIDSSKNISIQLFEYAGDNPVKSPSGDVYKVHVKADDDSEFKLYAENHSDRLNFGHIDSQSFHDALSKYDRLKVLFVEIGSPTTRYAFTIECTGYLAIYKKLME